MQTTLGTLGTNEIQAKLQDAEWKDIVIKKIEITVNEASNSVKDAPIDVTKVNNLSSDFIMGMDISSMISELQSGVVYRDYDGNELKTLDDICRFIKSRASITFVSVYGITRMMPMATAMAEETMMW